MAAYKDAIYWMVRNDDTQWLHDEYGSNSVTAFMCADLFNKTDEQVKKDLIKEEKKFKKRDQKELS